MYIKQIQKQLSTLGPIEIFIILTIIFLTVFTVKFFGKKKESLIIKVEVVRKNWSENYDPLGYRVPFWLSDKVKIGQTEKNKSGQIIATLINFESYDHGDQESELYLTLKVETLFDKRSGIYYYKDKPLNLGSPIELNLDNIEIYGQIIDNNVPQNGYPTKYFNIKARARNLDSWVYSKIIPGIKIYDRANNEVIGEIINTNLENSTLQEIKNDPNTGKYLQATLNKNKDLIVDIKLKAYQMDHRWFFSGRQNLKIGNPLSIYTPQVDLYKLEIENIEESK